MYEILLSPPDVGEDEIEAVVASMRSGWVAPAGPALAGFEKEVAERVEAPFAVALSSGTAALHLALVSWGVGPGDVVPVSTLTFAASVNAIRYVGAEPHFVDCDPSTGNINVDLLRDCLAALQAQGRNVPVIIPVDMLGKCANHNAIESVASEYGCRVLVDAAESLGATRDGRPAGSFGDASVLSFNGNKIATTSGGGMLVSRDIELIDHARKLATQAREPVRHYEHSEVGYNYRLSNILAAMGRVQLRRLDEMVQRRRSWRDRYRTLFSDSPGVDILGGVNDAEDNCWLTAILVNPEVSPWTVESLAQAMEDARIETRPVWKPMHQQPVNAPFRSTLDGSADTIFGRGLTLPSGSRMSDGDFAKIEAVIQRVTQRAT